jgi:hypothetical protein
MSTRANRLFSSLPLSTGACTMRCFGSRPRPERFASVVGGRVVNDTRCSEQRVAKQPLAIEYAETACARLARWRRLHALAGQRRPRGLPAQLCQSLAVGCLAAHHSTPTEAVDVGAQGLPRCGVAWHRPAGDHHLVTRARPKAMRCVTTTVCTGRRVRAWSHRQRLGWMVMRTLLHPHVSSRRRLRRPGDAPDDPLATPGNPHRTHHAAEV